MRTNKWTVASAGLLAAGTLAFGAGPALAAGPVAGSYTLADNGQGGWSGGPLQTNGSVGGGGAFSLSTPGGQIIERVVSGHWSPDGSGGVNICLSLIGIKNAPATDSFCADVPVTNTPIKITTADGGTTLIRVRLF